MATRSRTQAPGARGGGSFKHDLESGDAAFHLPIPGLFVDLDSASGSIALTDEFSAASPKTRVAVLQHWIRALASEREIALVQMFREFAELSSSSTIVSQVEQFRLRCSQEGIYCPDELPILLQRY